MSDDPPDKRAPRLVTLYLPAVFGNLAAIGMRPLCPSSGVDLLLSAIVTLLVVFVISWPFVMAAWHGYRFFRSLFQRS